MNLDRSLVGLAGRSGGGHFAAFVLMFASLTTLAVRASPGQALTSSCLAQRTRAGPLSMIHDRSFTAGYNRMLRDLNNRFWNPGVFSHIRPTRGGNPRVGEVDNGLLTPAFWQMASLANVLFWDVQLTRSSESRSRLVGQWRHIRVLWSDFRTPFRRPVGSDHVCLR